jgi:hypothetical protein
LVEAQHRISTNRLSANLDEQAELELLAEEVKPNLPENARHLDYLLASPFRYGHRQESRFRRADERPGIFYASESEATAIAEAAYWRLRFFSRSPGFDPPRTTSEHSSFSAKVASDRVIDLTEPPFTSMAAAWVAPDDYTACQDLTARAREVDTHIIRTVSVRDTEHRCNVVLLDPAAFTDRSPTPGKTWHLRIEEGRLIALAAYPSKDQFVFTAKGFGLV